MLSHLISLTSCKTNYQSSIKHNYVILFRKMTTSFSLSDHHHDMITKILKIMCNAVQIKLMIWEPHDLQSLYKTNNIIRLVIP